MLLLLLMPYLVFWVRQTRGIALPHQSVECFLSVVATLAHGRFDYKLVDSAFIREEGLQEVKGFLLGIYGAKTGLRGAVGAAVRSLVLELTLHGQTL